MGVLCYLTQNRQNSKMDATFFFPQLRNILKMKITSFSNWPNKSNKYWVLSCLDYYNRLYFTFKTSTKCSCTAFNQTFQHITPILAALPWLPATFRIDFLLLLLLTYEAFWPLMFFAALLFIRLRLFLKATFIKRIKQVIFLCASVYFLPYFMHSHCVISYCRRTVVVLIADESTCLKCCNSKCGQSAAIFKFFFHMISFTYASIYQVYIRQHLVWFELIKAK